MKNTFLLFVFILLASMNVIQSSDSAPNTTTTITQKLTTDQKLCYGETSKIAFFETLIYQNGLNIKLKESSRINILDKELIIFKSEDHLFNIEEGN